jgi:hypothetical protein
MNASMDSLSLVELYERTRIPEGVLIEWVAIGWLSPLETERRSRDPAEWRFPHEALGQARAAARLARELDLEPDVAILVHQLIRERQAAERRLSQALRLLGEG